MAGTQIDIAGMQAAKSKAESVHGEMNGLLSRVRSTMEQSSGVWKGDAQAAFTVVSNEYNSAAQKMSTAMDEMIQNLQASLTKYGAQEDDTTAAVKSAGGGLNMNV